MERKPLAKTHPSRPHYFAKKKTSNGKLNFFVNMRIVHVDFGTGTVIAVYDDEIRVRFDSSERGSRRLPKNSKKMMTVEDAYKKRNLRKTTV